MGAEEPEDCRQWTQHHLVAADIRVAPATALTPPQGDADADGVDVNVRGPGECPPKEALIGPTCWIPCRGSGSVWASGPLGLWASGPAACVVF
jgi:hypothetical protein